MTDGTRVLRTVAIPLVIAIVLLFLVPKTCEKALRGKKLQKGVLTRPAAPTDTGLHINSESPDAPPSRPIAWPAGLDAQRAQYLIEVDARFSEPAATRVPKPGAIALDNTAAEALVKAGYFEQAGGGYNPAVGASLHLDGMTEESLAWRVPLGQRKFGRVTSVDNFADGRAKVGFIWTWEPNDAGRAVAANLALHEGSAEFAGGGEHPWDLTAMTVDSDWK